jgi:hypothetical protein
MIAMRIAGATHRLGAPKGWDKDKDGNCGHLWVRVAGNVFTSAWEPTPGELQALNEGGSVRLSIVGGQPPVMLDIEPAPSIVHKD